MVAVHTTQHKLSNAEGVKLYMELNVILALTDGWMDQWVDGMIERLANWLSDWLRDWLAACLTEWQTNRSTGLLVGWLFVGWLIDSEIQISPNYVHGLYTSFVVVMCRRIRRKCFRNSSLKHAPIPMKHTGSVKVNKSHDSSTNYNGYLQGNKANKNVTILAFMGHTVFSTT